MSAISNIEIGTDWFNEQVFNHLVKNYSNKSFSIEDLKSDSILNNCIITHTKSHEPSSQPSSPKRKKSSGSKAQKASSPINPEKCQCRVWNHGYGGQCSFYKKEGDFCKRHASEALKIYEEHCKDPDTTLDLSDKVVELRNITERGILLHGWMGIITDERLSNPTKRDGASLTWIDSKPEKKIRSPPKTIKKTLEEDTNEYNSVPEDDAAGVGVIPGKESIRKSPVQENDKSTSEKNDSGSDNESVVADEDNADDDDVVEEDNTVEDIDDDGGDSGGVEDENTGEYGFDVDDEKEDNTEPGNFDDFDLSDEDTDEEE
jgi:hypothetical protein